MNGLTASANGQTAFMTLIGRRLFSCLALIGFAIGPLAASSPITSASHEPWHPASIIR